MTTTQWANHLDADGEDWRAVLGFPDYCATGGGKIRGPSGKILKPMKMPAGHLYVLCNRGKNGQRKLFVHRAVLLAFVGPPKPGQEARHLDGHPSNNNLENLKWGTRDENVEDRRNHGRMPIPHESSFTKLVPKDIPTIRALEGQQSSRTVAHAFDTSHTTILKIWRGERWKGY